MFDVLALVVLAREIVAEFVLAVEPELIRPGRMSVVRHNINAYLWGSYKYVGRIRLPFWCVARPLFVGVCLCRLMCSLVCHWHIY
jgi:hypothetical protein